MLFLYDTDSLVFITGSMLDNTFAYFHVYSIQGVRYFKCNSQGALFFGFEGFLVCVGGVWCFVFFFFVVFFSNLLHFEAKQNPNVTTK